MANQTSSRFLVTGAQGCIGAWVVKNLVASGRPPVVFDLETEPQRMSLIMPPEEIGRVTFIQGDVADGAHLDRVVVEHGISHIIHLAALQVPACRADPVSGAGVNIIGTLNVFEAVRRHSDQVRRVIYASSAAVIGPEEAYPAGPVPDDAPLLPLTHYGVFKQANEGNARVYWLDHGVSSIGLRPWTVYGPGRDQGLTSDPTKAIKAALLKRPYHIGFGGRIDMQFVDDVAQVFVACAEARHEGAAVFNLRGAVVAVADVVREIERQLPDARGLITHGETQLPIAPELDDRGLRALLGQVPETPLVTGIARTIGIFQQLEAEGRLDRSDLGGE